MDSAWNETGRLGLTLTSFIISAAVWGNTDSTSGPVRRHEQHQQVRAEKGPGSH